MMSSSESSDSSEPNQKNNKDEVKISKEIKEPQSNLKAEQLDDEFSDTSDEIEQPPKEKAKQKENINKVQSQNSKELSTKPQKVAQSTIEKHERLNHNEENIVSKHRVKAASSQRHSSSDDDVDGQIDDSKFVIKSENMAYRKLLK